MTVLFEVLTAPIIGLYAILAGLAEYGLEGVSDRGSIALVLSVFVAFFGPAYVSLRRTPLSVVIAVLLWCQPYVVIFHFKF